MEAPLEDRSGSWFRSLRLFHSYRALREARHDAAAVPVALVEAELLFGMGEVCVSMPWVAGREAKPADLSTPCVVNAIADALHWLACHRLIYVDVREPNVIINNAKDRAFVIDYDDMAVVDPAPATFEEFGALVTANLPEERVALFVAFLNRNENLAAALLSKWL